MYPKLITNFKSDRLEVFKTAIERYSHITGDNILYIKNKAYNTNDRRISDMSALKCTDTNRFKKHLWWSILGKVSLKNGEEYYLR